MENLYQKTCPQFVQVYHLVKYQLHLRHHNTQKSLFKHTQHAGRSLSEFVSSDKITFTSLKENLPKSQWQSLVHLSYFIIEDTLYVQSQQHLNGAPLIPVKIFKDLNFETYHCGMKCTISNLSKNNNDNFWWHDSSCMVTFWKDY